MAVKRKEENRARLELFKEHVDLADGITSAAITIPGSAIFPAVMSKGVEAGYQWVLQSTESEAIKLVSSGAGYNAEAINATLTHLEQMVHHWRDITVGTSPIDINNLNPANLFANVLQLFFAKNLVEGAMHKSIANGLNEDGKLNIDQLHLATGIATSMWGVHFALQAPQIVSEVITAIENNDPTAAIIPLGKCLAIGLAGFFQTDAIFRKYIRDNGVDFETAGQIKIIPKNTPEKAPKRNRYKEPSNEEYGYTADVQPVDVQIFREKYIKEGEEWMKVAPFSVLNFIPETWVRKCINALTVLWMNIEGDKPSLIEFLKENTMHIKFAETMDDNRTVMFDEQHYKKVSREEAEQFE